MFLSLVSVLNLWLHVVSKSFKTLHWTWPQTTSRSQNITLSKSFYFYLHFQEEFSMSILTLIWCILINMIIHVKSRHHPISCSIISPFVFGQLTLQQVCRVLLRWRSKHNVTIFSSSIYFCGRSKLNIDQSYTSITIRSGDPVSLYYFR